MTIYSVPTAYGPYRFDVTRYSILDNYVVHEDETMVLCTFAHRNICESFCKWYAKEYHSVMFWDAKTDEVAYYPPLPVGVRGAYIRRTPAGGERAPMPVSTNGHKHAEKPTRSAADMRKTVERAAEVVGVQIAKALDSPSSKRETAQLLLRTMKDPDAKPWPARRICEKAGIEYTIEVKRIMKEMAEKGYIVFDNGRWRLPTAKEKKS